MTEITVFPKHLTATLDLKDKILTIYQNKDLKEIVLLESLEDEWNDISLGGEDWDLNFYREKDAFKLNIHPIEEFGGEVLTDIYSFKEIELTVI